MGSQAPYDASHSPSGFNAGGARAGGPPIAPLARGHVPKDSTPSPLRFSALGAPPGPDPEEAEARRQKRESMLQA
ncbi:hypothetical protein CF319_g7574 [Tilletia indica]|uniref:Uncharacterized protein n=1 Tax=Tilletia indica TaxID=43049 RepID=A0A8T8SKQ0_9BASI|nr:hypothetical protein CF319_g7574 [Tilletia indica]KAE8228696.1 hypothetical protein CF326_g6364 [Tilletia indica]KAE8241783.1 hypothetical protein A4X13_0g7267 [Tilletia indica]